MSTTTASAEIPVPRELLPAFRDNVRQDLELIGDKLKSAASVDDAEQLAEALSEAEAAIAAHRAFLVDDLDAYPAAAVSFAAVSVIEDAESRIADDHLSLDEAEFYVKRARTCQALRDHADAWATTA